MQGTFDPIVTCSKSNSLTELNLMIREWIGLHAHLVSSHSTLFEPKCHGPSYSSRFLVSPDHPNYLYNRLHEHSQRHHTPEKTLLGIPEIPPWPLPPFYPSPTHSHRKAAPPHALLPPRHLLSAQAPFFNLPEYSHTVG